MSIHFNSVRLNDTQDVGAPASRKFAPPEKESVFDSDKTGTLEFDTIETGSGVFNETKVSNHETENQRTFSPKDRVVNIDTNASDEDLDKSEEPTFKSFHDLIHDVYGNGGEIKLSDEEYRQILYAIVTDPANEAIFKDFMGSEKYQKFLDAYNTEDPDRGYIAMYNMLDGLVDNINGLTLPDVDTQ